MQKVLIIDDNASVCEAIRLLLEIHDIESQVVLTPQAGLSILGNSNDIGLVIQDMNFTEDITSGTEGKELFHAIRELKPDIPVILLTAWTHLETAVELVRLGAADYIAKPWDDKKLITTIINLLELQELQTTQLEQAHDLLHDKQELEKNADLRDCIYFSKSMQSLVKMAVQVAKADIPVLITGPNGSGKEKIAEIIQANSAVKDGPFIKVNVGALPSELIEAELFGAESGAYTGNTKRRIGRFEAADGGTLFLDELGNLSPSGQIKLLRVLQTGEFERLGSHETIRCKVRVISATNSDLLADISEGRFREDLYYRLNVIELKLPPLSERREDILPLLHHFLGEQYSVDTAAAKILCAYDWPGNVRELRNAAQRAMVFEENRLLKIDAFDIKLPYSSSKKVVVEPTVDMIKSALKQNQGVISRAASQLGLSRQALYRRLEKLDIEY